MKDITLIELLTTHNEIAIIEVEKEYKNYLKSIALRILKNNQDADECVNDTLEKIWNTIPPLVPKSLKAYIGTLIRNISLDCYRKNHMNKRNSDFLDILDECNDCGNDSTSITVEMKEISTSISNFLRDQKEEKRFLFIGRYYYGYSNIELAKKRNITEGKVKMTLSRMRNELRKYLEKDGIFYDKYK